MKIIALGKGEWMYHSIEYLLESSKHELVGIIKSPSNPGDQKRSEDFYKLALKYNIPILLNTKDLYNNRAKELISKAEIGVSVNWSTIIQKDTIELLKYGILNAHMGDLPKYRGNAVPNWAILNGESEIVTSIHFMEPDLIDGGHIIIQKHIKINHNTTISNIYEWGIKAIPEGFYEAIEILEQNPDYFLKFANVNDIENFRCYPRVPTDSFIDWDLPVENIDRLIRASGHSFKGAYTYFFNGEDILKIYIKNARVQKLHTGDYAVNGAIIARNPKIGEISVKCGKGILAIKDIEINGESKKAADIFKSIRLRLKIKPEDMLYMLWKKLI